MNTEHFYTFLASLSSSVLAGLFLKEKQSKQNHSLQLENGLLQKLPILDEEIVIQPKTINPISERIIKAIELLNQRGKFDKIVVNETAVAACIGINSLEDVMDIITGKVLPDLDKLLKFCDGFNICADWIQTGVGTPYHSSMHSLYSASKVIDSYAELKPERVIFFTTNNDELWTCIGFIIDDNKFYIYHRNSNCKLSSKVGRGGTLQMVELYKAIRHFSSKSSGYIISESTFNDLTDGKISIYSAIANGKHSDLCEDFKDINHNYPISESYGSMYGEEFLKAQKIVRYELETMS